MTRLILVRHGESRAIVERFISGHDTCTGLTPLGFEQATALRDRLASTGELGTDVVMYASVLRRAIETAQVIAPALRSSEYTTECDFCEIHQGEGEGLGWEEFEQRYGHFNPLADRSRSIIPGGESIDRFVARVRTGLQRVADAHPGSTIVVVCHGGVVACALEALSGVPFGTLARYTANTAMTEWERDYDPVAPTDDGNWWLVRFNDAAHLSRAASPG